MAPAFLGSLLVVTMMIAGLLYMIGAGSLAGRVVRAALFIVLCYWLSNTALCLVKSIDLRALALFSGVALIGLLGFLLAYLYFKRRKERRKLETSARHHAPEPVPDIPREEELR